jgi:hypothetical protein
MTRAALIGVLTALFLSGCGDQAREPGLGGADASLRLTHVLDRTAPALYIEGSVWHVRVFDSDGRAIVDQQIKGEHASLDISPGRYRFVSEELPCDGNCGLLDPGTDGCSEEFVVESGKQLTATVTLRPTQGCTIEFGT